jgi:hypothetical protein
MCAYGKAFQLKFGLYIAVNKDDDDIHYEMMELDWNYATELENKARDIIYSKFPPRRISENPASWECTYCVFKEICHAAEKVEINCRSCKLSEPRDKGQWYCNRWNNIIPSDFIKTGCEFHISVNE